jgi:hypothetical protein
MHYKLPQSRSRCLPDVLSALMSTSATLLNSLLFSLFLSGCGDAGKSAKKIDPKGPRDQQQEQCHQRGRNAALEWDKTSGDVTLHDYNYYAQRDLEDKCGTVRATYPHVNGCYEFCEWGFNSSGILKKNK